MEEGTQLAEINRSLEASRIRHPQRRRVSPLVIHTVLAVILAAGGSSRMGRPKALLRLPDNRTLLQAHLDALSSLPTRVVQGRWALPVPAVHNPDWARSGMVESLALALRGSSHRRVLVTPVDAAPVAPEDLQALLRCEGPATLVWEGRAGHPILVPRDAVRPPTPLDRLRFERVQASSERVLVDLDTLQDWEAFRAGRG